MQPLDEAGRRLRARFDAAPVATDHVHARAAVIRRRRAATAVALPLLLVVTAVGLGRLVQTDGGVSLETDPATAPELPVTTVPPDDELATTTTTSSIASSTTTIATGVPAPTTSGPITVTTTAAPTTTTARTPKQGPSQPTITVADSRDPSGSDPPNMVKVAAVARDEDGFITRFTVDYGDGSPIEEYGGDRMGCREGPGGYTAASQSQLPTNPPPTHTYASSGAYVVTVTVHTAGCDGLDDQLARGSFTWQVP